MNSNGNPRGYAIITFESQEELERARSKPINYGNHTLFWDRYEARKVSVKEGKGKNVELREEEKEEAAGQEMDYEYQNKDIKKNERKRQKEKMSIGQSREEKKLSDEILLRILNRLDKLEIQQEIRFADHGFANRS